MRSAIWLVFCCLACGEVKVTTPDAPPGFPRLTVEVTGDGNVTSTPAGIDCPGTCTAAFEPGTEVTLAASTTSPIVFTGWADGCAPSRFDCALTLDADANVTAGFAMQGTKRWLQTAGAVGGSVEVHALGTGGGAVGFAGTVNQPTTIGGRVATGGMFVTSLDSATGEAAWLNNVAGTTPLDVVVDSNNNVIAGGFFSGMANFGDGNVMASGATDAFAVKYGPDGSHVWSKPIGGTSLEFGTALAVAPNGDVLVGGSYSGTANFGNGDRTSSGSDDAFVARYGSADGALQWATTFGNANTEQLYGLAVDPNGSIAMAGTFTGNLSLAFTFMQSGMTSDGFIGRLDGASGNILFGKDLGGNNSDAAWRIATDPDGNLYVIGFCNAPLDVGGQALPADSQMFVAKYTSAGAHIWSRGLPINPERLVVDSFGDVVLGGTFQNTVDLGDGVTLSSAGTFDGYLFKLSGATGSTIWGKRFGGADTDTITGMTVDAVDRIYVTGIFEAFADFDGQSLTPVGNRDLFVMSFEP